MKKLNLISSNSPYFKEKTAFEDFIIIDDYLVIRESNYVLTIFQFSKQKSDSAEFVKEILLENDITLKNYIDAGSMLITDENLSLMGGSGPVCLPLFLTEKILKQKKYKHILIIGTGSLHNVSIVNSKRSVPSISHAVSLEVIK